MSRSSSAVTCCLTAICASSMVSLGAW